MAFQTPFRSKLGRVVRMVVDSILPHGEFGPNDHRKDAPPFRTFKTITQFFDFLSIKQKWRLKSYLPPEGYTFIAPES